MKYRSILAVLLMFLIAAMPMTLSAAPAPAPATGGGINIPVTGTFAPSSTPGPLSTLGSGTVSGVLNIQRFVNNNGTLTAVGTLTTQLKDAAGNVVSTLVQQVAIPVISANGACPILHLDLGPLHLDLLGLQIDLSRIVLDIVAQSGPGNLLGNLLCAVANLLNGGGPLGTIANLLNQILAILNGLLG